MIDNEEVENVGEIETDIIMAETSQKEHEKNLQKDGDGHQEESGETTDTSSEKNESRDFEDDDSLQCFDCKVTDCMMWRKVKDGDQSGLVCNLCHLKRVKGASNQTQASSNSSTQSNSKLTQIVIASKIKDTVRISKRKNKTNKKFTNSIYGDKFIKNNHAKSRRNIYKKKPTKSVMGISSIVASQSIYHNGLLYQVGDIVCTSDVEGGIYYAQLRGFLQDDFCERAAVVTWLIPTQRHITKFDPMLFVPGLDEDTPRSMDCFNFVCRASDGLFKTKNSHPPYLRSQSDLNNLIYVANAFNTQSQKQDQKTIIAL